MEQAPASAGGGPQEFASATARRGLRRGLGILFAMARAMAIAALAFSRTEIGAAALQELWGRARWPPLVLAFLLMTMAFLFMALRWRALLPGPARPPVTGLTAIVCAGLLLNYALPGPMGEIGAAWFASRRYGVPIPVAIASGVAARLVGLASAALTAALVWGIADLPIPAELRGLVRGAVLVLALGGALLGAVTARPEPWKRLAHRLLRPFVAAGGRVAALATRVDGLVAHIADSLAAVAHAPPGAWLRAGAWSLASHASVIAGMALLAYALGARPLLAGLVFTYASSTAGTVLLFLLPGSQIGWDAMMAGLLVATAGLDLTVATAVAVLVRGHHLVVMALGAVSLAWLLRGAGPSAPAGPGLDD